MSIWKLQQTYRRKDSNMSKGKRNRIKHNKEKQLSNQEQVVVAYYRSHLTEFIESHLDVQLKWWQKKLLNIIQRGN